MKKWEARRGCDCARGREVMGKMQGKQRTPRGINADARERKRDGKEKEVEEEEWQGWSEGKQTGT